MKLRYSHWLLALASVLMATAMLVMGLGSLSAQEQQPPETPVTSDVGTGFNPVVTSTPGPLAALSATIQMVPYNDAPVASGGPWSPDQNLGGLQTLAVGWHDGGDYRSFIRFNLANLPSGIQIDSAQLILTPLDGGSQPVPIAADVVQQGWNEASITWNQEPLFTWQGGVGTWQPDTSGQLSLDVTGAVQTWYSCGDSTNNGLVLASDLSLNSWVDFASRKSDTPPMLQLTYEPATTTMSCATASLNGANLSSPAVIGPSSSGAALGSVNPNQTLNGLTIVPTPCNVICTVAGATVNSASGQGGGLGSGNIGSASTISTGISSAIGTAVPIFTPTSVSGVSTPSSGVSTPVTGVATVSARP